MEKKYTTGLCEHPNTTYGLGLGLKKPLICHEKLKFGVGGLLPLYETDGKKETAIIGISDFTYKRTDSDNDSILFATEMKRSAVYPINEPWYRRSRAAQCFGCLYFSGVPLLLSSPSSYKLLIEKRETNTLFVYPNGYYSGSTDDQSFLDVLTILISSNKIPYPKSFLPSTPIRTKTSANKIIPTTMEKLTKKLSKVFGKSSVNQDDSTGQSFSENSIELRNNYGSIFFLSEEEIEAGLSKSDSYIATNAYNNNVIEEVTKENLDFSKK